jgi:nicotinate dehydrogenase subunit A
MPVSVMIPCGLSRAGDFSMGIANLRLRINGSERTVQADENTPLLDVLRNDCGLKGTRFGCGSGECGACHVLVDGVSVPACDTPVGAVQHQAIVTVEGLAPDGAMGALQRAFLAEQAGQCGYCLSGILVTATALLARLPHPTEAQVREALDGNLCRCGVHNRVVRAVLRAAGSGARA